MKKRKKNSREILMSSWWAVALLLPTTGIVAIAWLICQHPDDENTSLDMWIASLGEEHEDSVRDPDREDSLDVRSY
jgi:hypothetical protein